MKDKNKPKEQSADELTRLRDRIAMLETELKQAAAKTLLDEDSKSEAILSAIGDGISIQATNFRILYQNKIHKALFGDHTGELCYQAYRQRENKCDECPVALSFKDDKIHKVERSLITDKGVMHIAITASHLKNPAGETIAGIEVVRDVTKRKQAEEALRAEKARWEAILDAIGDAVSIQDTEFKILYQNQTHKNLTGNHIGEYCYKAYNLRADVCEPCPLAMTFKDGKIHTIEKPAATHTGIESIEISASPLKDSKGKIIAGIEVARDTTERKKSQEALISAEAKFRSLVEQSLVGIYIIQDNKFLYVNPKVSELVGYSQEEIISSKKVSDLIAKEDLDMVAENIRKRMTGEAQSIQYTFKVERKDGVLIDVEAHGTRTDFSGSPAIIGTLLDITGRKKMETELQKNQKLESLGILAGGIAHDFNNILTAITGNVSLAKMYVKPGLEAYDILTEVEKAALKAKNLTTQLLTFSKGGAPLKKTISISKLLRDSANFAISGSNVKCEFSISENLYATEVDEGQISHVIHHMIINAQQAMPQGGTIKITVENIDIEKDNYLSLSAGHYVKISIRDQGIGIPEEYLPNIFDPYFTTKQGGSGLGLATAYSIIKKHNGHITAESKLGEGTTFFIYLPASTEKNPTVKSTGKAPYAVKGSGKVLVMDDDDTVRLVVGRMLGQCGYEADFAEDGVAAIESYEKAKDAGKPYEAVIIDLVIPAGMGGKETIKKLLELDPNVKAVVSSGYSDDPVMANFQEYGFKGALAKPFEIAELRQMLHEVIRA